MSGGEFVLILIALTAPVAPAWSVTPKPSTNTPAMKSVLDPSMRIPMRSMTWGGVQTMPPSTPPMADAASLSRRDWVFVVSDQSDGTAT